MNPSSSYASIANAIALGWKRPEKLDVSAWADRYRMLPAKGASEAGRWRTDRAPYLREILDQLSSHSRQRRTVMVKATQVGGTEVILNWLGATIHNTPGPMMVVQPTIDLAERFSKQRVAPMIEESAPLRSRIAPAKTRDSGNTTLLKDYPGGQVIIAGANSAAGLRSMPVRDLALDEVDAYPDDLDGEGDPVALAERRTTTFPRRKILLVSTPTIMGASRIWSEWQASDQRRYYVPCPHCDHYQHLRWPQLQWLDDRPETAAYVCEECAATIEEHHKTTMLAAGEWRATYPDRSVVGYHLNALYTPLGLGDTWADHAAAWMEVKKDPARLKTWVNTVLGEPWEDRSNTLDDAELSSRVEDVPLRTIPSGYMVLTMGVDVQIDRLSCSIWAWGRGETRWLVDRVVLPGDPNAAQVWQDLTMLRHTPVANSAGMDLRVSMSAIDSGGAHTHEVYSYVRQHRHDRVIAVKGSSQTGKPILGRPSWTDVNWRGRTIRQGVQIWPVGTDTAKHALISRLVGDGERGPQDRLVRFPSGLGDAYFLELSAEAYDPAKKRYVLRRNRPNEALDEAVYAHAAACHPSVRVDKMREADWARMAEMLEPAVPDLFAPRETKQENARPETPSPANEAATRETDNAAAPRKPKKPSGGWIDTGGGWM